MITTVSNISDVWWITCPDGSNGLGIKTIDGKKIVLSNVKIVSLDRGEKDGEPISLEYTTIEDDLSNKK